MFLTETKCKIRFICKIQLQKKKSGIKKWVAKSAIKGAKSWKMITFLEHFPYFVADYELFCTFTGLNNAVVYQNWQILGMPSRFQF